MSKSGRRKGTYSYEIGYCELITGRLYLIGPVQQVIATMVWACPSLKIFQVMCVLRVIRLEGNILCTANFLANSLSANWDDPFWLIEVTLC